MTRGIARERQVRKLMDAQGWWTCRAAGSLGDADIVACTWLGRNGPKVASEVRLIEIKANKGSPWKSFGPVSRNELSAAAKKAGATAWLCHWPPHGQPDWIPEKDWPT